MLLNWSLFFETCVIDDGLTSTNIVLVPKKQFPNAMTDLRPISLCNVVYKTASLVIANRLMEVIGTVISENPKCIYPWTLDLRKYYDRLRSYALHEEVD